MVDLFIVLVYFTVIFWVALRGKQDGKATVDSYFLSNRNLRWPSVAISTIATNIQGYQFLGMMGSAYLFGLAQASLEINAVQGILIAAFVFVPMYLKDRVITITQFIGSRLGNGTALVYSCANILMFSTITLGAALFWGAYAADLVFSDYLVVLHPDRIFRIAILLVGLGVFSAIYTYLGGLSAVVRTDIIQFAILLTGGLAVLFIAIHHLGGWNQLYEKTGDMMHLHLPADHDTLPWIHIFGLFLLNINYWCANQTVMQRSLAAKNLREAQIGLMAGGVMKYLMAVVIVIPGIALSGILGPEGLEDPDMAFPYLVSNFLPVGLKGIILCALFASLMSTVDSTYNSLATLFSIDIYKTYINKNASEYEIVSTGRKVILLSLVSGITMGLVLLILKFKDPGAAFTHTLNELRYYINCGIVVLICGAATLIAPRQRTAILAFFSTIPLHLLFIQLFPGMNYFVRAFWVIFCGYVLLSLLHTSPRWKEYREWTPDHPTDIKQMGWGLLISLVVLHIVFH